MKKLQKIFLCMMMVSLYTKLELSDFPNRKGPCREETRCTNLDNQQSQCRKRARDEQGYDLQEQATMTIGVLQPQEHTISWDRSRLIEHCDRKISELDQDYQQLFSKSSPLYLKNRRFMTDNERNDILNKHIKLIIAYRQLKNSKNDQEYHYNTDSVIAHTQAFDNFDFDTCN